MIIIGSTAINHWISSFRQPKDIDVIISPTESYPTDNNYDVSVLPLHIIQLIPSINGYATLDALYTLKLSHLGWDIFWQKHKHDMLFLKKQGCVVIESLYEVLVEYWKEHHQNKPYLSLYKSKQQFFNDYVTYVHDHDYLHELIAFPNQPIYKHCLKENNEVAICKTKFNMLSFEEQIQMFREEINVIAVERWLLNPVCKGKVSLHKAYALSLHKTVTSLTKNWACEFIIRNLEYFIVPRLKDFEHLLKTLDKDNTVMGTKFSSQERDRILNTILEQQTNPSNDQYAIDNFDGFLYQDIQAKGLEFIEQQGALSDYTEHGYTIFKFNDCMYKLEYTYYSHEGIDMDQSMLSEVIPVVKTITVYE